jgi:transcriptional regulator with XRE-family HTH domain
MDELPNRIRELRKAKDWTLEMLADRVGCGVTQMSDLERGVRPLNWHWLQSVSRALKVQPADLLSQKDNRGSLSAGEMSLVALFRQASEDQQRQLLDMARVIVGDPQPRGRGRPRRVA